jgi:DNA-binding IclR family transcriptional regulator
MPQTVATSPAAERKSTNLATARTLVVLAAFSEREGPAGVTELSRQLGMTKNMVFRALATLEQEGYLIRDDSGVRYELGFKLLELHNRTEEEPDIRSLCWPYMERMWELTGATIYLSVRSRWRVVLVDGIPGQGSFRARIIRGFSAPLHASVGARAVLAFLTDEEISEYIRVSSPLRRFNERTIVDPEKLWEEIALVRERGYSVGYGDHVAHRSGVAFAVLDASNRPHAAVTVSGPQEIFPTELLESYVPKLRAIARELNRHSRLYYANASPEAAAPYLEGVPE